MVWLGVKKSRTSVGWGRRSCGCGMRFRLDNLLDLCEVALNFLVGYDIVLQAAAEVLVVGGHVDQAVT